MGEYKPVQEGRERGLSLLRGVGRLGRGPIGVPHGMATHQTVVNHFPSRYSAPSEIDRIGSK